MRLSTLNKEQFGKIVKTAVYIAASGAISALLAYVTDNKEALGVYYVFVNLGLVTLKQFFTDK